MPQRLVLRQGQMPLRFGAVPTPLSWTDSQIWCRDNPLHRRSFGQLLFPH